MEKIILGIVFLMVFFAVKEKVLYEEFPKPFLKKFFNWISFKKRNEDYADEAFKDEMAAYQKDKAIKEGSEDIIKLYGLKELIDKEKGKGVFDKSNLSALINYLSDLCKTRSDCEKLFDNYNKQFDSSIVEDLKGVASNFETIKEVLSVFIEFDMIEETYPHAEKYIVAQKSFKF